MTEALDLAQESINQRMNDYVHTYRPTAPAFTADEVLCVMSAIAHNLAKEIDDGGGRHARIEPRIRRLAELAKMLGEL